MVAEESVEFFRCWQLQAIPRWQAIDQLDALDPLDTGFFSSLRRGVSFWGNAIDWCIYIPGVIKFSTLRNQTIEICGNFEFP